MDVLSPPSHYGEKGGITGANILHPVSTHVIDTGCLPEVAAFAVFWRLAVGWMDSGHTCRAPYLYRTA